jgi:TonB family protein
VLAADGTVRHILILKSLSYGLTERAVAAARKIRFEPATMNGVPVSQYVVLEYNFNIY